MAVARSPSQLEPAVDVHEAPLFPSSATQAGASPGMPMLSPAVGGTTAPPGAITVKPASGQPSKPAPKPGQ